MNKDFSFYEFTGICLPGAVFLGGIFGLHEESRNWILSEDFGASQLILFVIGSYVGGHLLQGIGNLVEKIFWFRRGMPSHWITRDNVPFLTTQQTDSLQDLYEALTGNSFSERWGLSQATTRKLTGSLFSSVRHEGCTDRIDVFNGNYGLFRGLATAFTILAICSLFQKQAFSVSSGLILAAVISFVRMQRFATYYASELYRQAFAIFNKQKQN